MNNQFFRHSERLPRVLLLPLCPGREGAPRAAVMHQPTPRHRPVTTLHMTVHEALLHKSALEAGGHG